MSKYPELDKLAALSDRMDVAREFYAFLVAHSEVAVCRLTQKFTNLHGDEYHMAMPQNIPIEHLLYEHFGIDADQVERERRALLESHREAAS